MHRPTVAHLPAVVHCDAYLGTIRDDHTLTDGYRASIFILWDKSWTHQVSQVDPVLFSA